MGERTLAGGRGSGRTYRMLSAAYEQASRGMDVHVVAASHPEARRLADEFVRLFGGNRYSETRVLLERGPGGFAPGNVRFLTPGYVDLETGRIATPGLRDVSVMIDHFAVEQTWAFRQWMLWSGRTCPLFKLEDDVSRDPYVHHAVALLRGGAVEDEVIVWLVESLVRDRERLVRMAKRALELQPPQPLLVDIPGGYKALNLTVSAKGGVTTEGVTVGDARKCEPKAK